MTNNYLKTYYSHILQQSCENPKVDVRKCKYFKIVNI